MSDLVVTNSERTDGTHVLHAGKLLPLFTVASRFPNRAIFTFNSQRSISSQIRLQKPKSTRCSGSDLFAMCITLHNLASRILKAPRSDELVRSGML